MANSSPTPRRKKQSEFDDGILPDRWAVQFRIHCRRRAGRRRDSGWERYGSYRTMAEALAKLSSSYKEFWLRPYDFRVVRISEVGSSSGRQREGRVG